MDHHSIEQEAMQQCRAGSRGEASGVTNPPPVLLAQQWPIGTSGDVASRHVKRKFLHVPCVHILAAFFSTSIPQSKISWIWPCSVTRSYRYYHEAEPVWHGGAEDDFSNVCRKPTDVID